MNHFSTAAYEFVSIIMAMLMAIGIIATPMQDNVVTAENPETVIDFVVTGDTHVSNMLLSREPNLIAMSKDLKNCKEELDAFLIIGDITENGFQDEYDRVYTDIHDIKTKNFIMCAGNHDIRLRDFNQSKTRYLDFMNKLNNGNNPQSEIYYKYMVEGYTFLVLGSENMKFEDAYISPEQLKWLDTELALATKEGKPCFVICHYPLAESHGLPYTWGSTNKAEAEGTLPMYEPKSNPDYKGSIGEQSFDVYTILTKYKNVFFITGHLHTGFGRNTYQTISAQNNVQGINVPSVGIGNKDGVYGETGTGLYVEVTPSEVIFRARNFAEGKFLSTDEYPQAVNTFPIV